MRTKICKECGQELPVCQYYTHKSSADGLRSSCKKCMSDQRKAKYVPRPKKVNMVVTRTVTPPMFVTKIEKVEMVGVAGAKFVVRVTCDNGETYTQGELAMAVNITRDGLRLRIKTCGLNNDIIFLGKDEYKIALKKQREGKKKIMAAEYDMSKQGSLAHLSDVVRSYNLAKLPHLGMFERGLI